MSSENKAERYTFAALLLVVAAIIILSFNSLPMNKNVEVTGVAVTVKTTAVTTEAKSSVATKKDSLVNLNTATAEELDALEGIGEKKAKDIITYRNKLGGYTSIEQLKDISGFGEATFNKIKNNITV
ncbi:MAG: helix-hairpin-helix domain-containing protein [Clostridia bacterium]|nr:helix-hairpin-helix domain-containing protein [Clostridia bacterium]